MFETIKFNTCCNKALNAPTVKKLTTIRTFSTIQDLYLAKVLLSENGIESYTADENIDVIIGTSISEGYRLQIDVKDKANAETILEKLDNKQLNDPYSNYPKILLNIICTLFLSLLTFLSYYNLSFVIDNFYNLSNSNKFQTIYDISANIIMLISCIGVFYKSKLSWYFLSTSLITSILTTISAYQNYESVKYSLVAAAIVSILLGSTFTFFTSKKVVNYFNIKSRGKSVIIAIIMGIIIYIPQIIMKPIDNNEVLSSMYMTYEGENAYHNLLPYTGKVINYYSNGQIELQGIYKNGKRDGIWFEFYENGKPLKIVKYKNGIYNGEYKEYYINGNILSNGIYNNGQKDSIWNSYYSDNKLMLVESFRNGLEDGLFLKYNENGKLSLSETYSKGELNGEAKMWDEEGLLSSLENYRNGQKHGQAKTWFKGKIYSEINYSNDQKEGFARYYDNQGIIETEGLYKNDEKVGVWKEYDVNGQIIAERLNRNDSL